MKTRSTITALFLILILAGCQKPNPVEVTMDREEPQLEVTSLAMVDTSVYTAIDTAAVTPADQDRFAGLLLVSNITFDGGSRWGVQSIAVSSVCVTDRSRPLQVRDRIFGYYGIRLLGMNPLTLVRVNGLAMREKAHRVRVAGIPVNFGYEYDRDVSSIYQPDLPFTWTAAPDSLGPVQVSIQSPANLTVASPVGGSFVPRNRDLRLEWTGQGEIVIILSAYNPIGKQSRPILRMRPLVNRGHARISASILQALPTDRYYVFTFIVANRKEVRIDRGSESVLVLAQAASVHNVYVEFQ